MRKLLFAVFATALFASCAQTEIEVRPIVEATGDFTASFEVDSRAELDGTSTIWNSTDKITIFTLTSHNRRYGIKSLSDENRTADFTYEGYTGSDETAPVANFGIYPYNENITLSGYNITTTINAEQTYNAEKVDLANSIMVAKSDDTFLAFKNATALLRFRLTNITPDNYTLSSIKVESANNLLAGQAVINFEGDVPVTTVSEGGSQVVTLTGINTQITNDTHDFYISLPATEFEAEDLTVTFTYEGGNYKEINVAKAISLPRGTIYTLKHTITGSDFTGTTNPYEENVEVATAEDLTAALQAVSTNGGEITLTENIELNEILTISGTAATRAAANATITIDGNGKKLTSTAGRAINIDTTHDVVIKNLTIECSGERAINVINQPANVTIENVTAEAASYTVNAAGTAANTVIAVKNSNLTGLNTVNICAAGATVTVEDTTITCNDQSEIESYAALCLHKDAIGATLAANGCTFVINGGGDSVKAKNESDGGTLTIDGSADDVVVMVAAIIYGGQYYGFQTIEAAIEEAKAGQTVTLLRDITSSEIIVVDKAITIDGNGKTLTSTAGRAINIDTTGNVAIKNLTIECSGERGINVINQPANVTIENVTAVADNYTVNAAGTADNTVITVKNSDLTGLNTVNIAAANATVTVENTKITCDDQSEIEGYAALCLNKDATGATLTANGCTFVIKDDSDKAKNDAINGTLTIDDSADEVVVMVAAIIYGDYYYSFSTIGEAIEKAIEDTNDDNTITILRQIVIDEDVTLDLQGMKIVAASNFELFKVVAGGKLTIDNGTVEAFASTIWNDGGDVIIEGGNYNQTGRAAGTPSTRRYSIKTSGGTTIINGGTFTSNNGIMDVSANVIINGGKFTNDMTDQGTTRHFAYISGSGSLTINDGEFKGIASSSGGGEFICIYTANGKVDINGGWFTSLWTSGSKNSIISHYTSGSTVTVDGGYFNHNGGISSLVKDNEDAATKDAYPYVAK